MNRKYNIEPPKIPGGVKFISLHRFSYPGRLLSGILISATAYFVYLATPSF